MICEAWGEPIQWLMFEGFWICETSSGGSEEGWTDSPAENSDEKIQCTICIADR
jgi:hypothetical protein